MAEKKTISISSDPVFLEELSEYLEVLSNPLRLQILKFIEREPKEITAIAEYTGMSYQNTKKHLDRLVSTSLIKRAAGYGRETERGIAPVWKYSLAEGALENLAMTLGVFSSIATPMGYNDIRECIQAVRVNLQESGGPSGPVLYLSGARRMAGHFFSTMIGSRWGARIPITCPGVPGGWSLCPTITGR